MTAVTWELLVIVIALWLAAGLTSASILYRRGRDGWRWMFICAFAGPFAATVVTNQALAREQATPLIPTSADAGVTPETARRDSDRTPEPGNSLPVQVRERLR